MCDSSSSHDDGTYATGVNYGVSGALAAGLDAAVGATGGSGVIGQSNTDLGITGNASFTLEGWFQSTHAVQNQVRVAIGNAPSGTDADQVVGLATWTKHTSGAGNARNYPTTLALDENGRSSCWDTSTAGVDLYDGN